MLKGGAPASPKFLGPLTYTKVVRPKVTKFGMITRAKLKGRLILGFKLKLI